jgi:hypothetical protein
MGPIATRSRSGLAIAGLPTRVAGWIATTAALTLVLWIVGLAGLLTLAGHDHVDIPPSLAAKLPLLKSNPRLIFGGESRTEFGVDPVLAGDILAEPNGYAVNIAYDAGEPLAYAAAAKLFPEVFRHAHVVLSIAPFTFNEGVGQASVYPLDVLARLSVSEQLATFLPLRIGTLVRYIREAFASRLAQQQQLAFDGPIPPRGGLGILDRVGEGRPNLGEHPYYAHWDLSGPKTRFAVEAFCQIAGASARLTVVDPPWFPEDRSQDADWNRYESELVSVLRTAGQRCGFDVLHIVTVPSLTGADFADEMHLNPRGVPIYTRYLLSQLGLEPQSEARH